MARTRRSIAKRYLDRIEQSRPTYEVAASQAEALIREILVNTPAVIHLIDARCKQRSSLWLKLCEKRYMQPARQLTDVIGARVITYYNDEVPSVVTALSSALEVDAQRSVNKREQLAAIEFGYRSVHLIVRTRGSWFTSPQYEALRNIWFEIQVRSILEHAWAEIEHEVVYKSGITYPVLVKRRFARMAGAIEILEDEFVMLRKYQDKMVDFYKQRYSGGRDSTIELDSVRLIALLECERPESLGWRAATRSGQPFAPHLDNRCVKALKRSGIRTPLALRAMLRSKIFERAEVMFAEEHRISEPLSHLNTARIAVLLRSPTIFSDYFPEMSADVGIQRLLLERKRGRLGASNGRYASSGQTERR